MNIFLSKGEVHAVLRNPYRAKGGNHHSGNKMALDNVRERLALHFDAEASLESQRARARYEVHIRMPYRTENRGAVPAAAARAVAGRRRRPSRARRVRTAPTRSYAPETAHG